MIYYETILMFFLILTIIPIVAGFLIKNKFIRIFCWLISIPFLSMTISTISKHSSDINKQTSEFLGLYKIDLERSIYKNGDLTIYQNLTMTVNSDETFIFSDTSMFSSKKGKWVFKSTEDGGFVNCKFPGKDYEILAFVGNNSWGFQQACFRDGSNGDDLPPKN